ncbi:MAG: formylglycine-generating enzyme family protein [Candidatus Poseidoniaceae archaeon]
MNANRPSFEDTFGGSYLLVEPGQFLLGDEVGSGHPNEQPIVSVEITDPFFLGVRPVTQAHWASVMNNNPSKFQEGWSAGLRPVESISYTDVELFLKRLNNEQQEYIGFLGNWRLPTESEWEYVAKAGTSTRWSFGDKDSELDAHGWHAGNSGATTREVGSKKANPWGYFDMHGLVYEMTSDSWMPKHLQNENKSAHPTEVQEYYVAKGGSWFTESDSTRSSSRRRVHRKDRKDGVGIRLVWEPTEQVT